MANRWLRAYALACAVAIIYLSRAKATEVPDPVFLLKESYTSGSSLDIEDRPISPRHLEFRGRRNRAIAMQAVVGRAFRTLVQTANAVEQGSP